MIRKCKTLSFFKKHLIEDGIANKEEIFASYGDYSYRRKSSFKRVRGLRNKPKLVKVFINEENIGYVLLDRQNRNLHIYGEIKDIKTNY